MTPQYTQRIERKFTFLAANCQPLLSLVDHFCVPDPVYPLGIVSSIYYDTPDLAAYNEKRDGDYMKCKVRLRWYARPDQPCLGTDVPCFLEVKRRIGGMVDKSRIGLSLPADLLADNPLVEDRIADLPSYVPSLGQSIPGILVPILHVRYQRHRFVDMETHVRVSVDTDICGVGVNDAFIAAHAPVALGTGVLELKGDRGGWPLALAPIRSYLAAGSFSKYACCLEAAREPLGRRE